MINTNFNNYFAFFNKLVSERAEVIVDPSFMMNPLFTEIFVPAFKAYNSGNETPLKLNVFDSSIISMTVQMLHKNNKPESALAIRDSLNEVLFTHNIERMRSHTGAHQMDVLEKSLSARMHHKVVVLTMNKKQTGDLYHFNHLASCSGYGSITVFGFGSSGEMIKIDDAEGEEVSGTTVRSMFCTRNAISA